MFRTRHTIIVLGFALFAMFFGAGNLIFPPALGRLFGDGFSWAAIGFLLTGVGLPLMGVMAVAKAEGGIDRIAARLDPRIAKLLSIIVMLAIGPFLAIPRTAATTFELGIAPNLPWLGLAPFSVIYFVVVLFFALNPLSVVDRIGKILTPLLLAALLALIFKGLAHPIAAPIAGATPHPFGTGLIEGYQTMDLMGAVIFGIIILNELRSKGVFEKSLQMKSIVRAGLISAGGLAVVYGGLVYLGATTSATIGEMSRTQLLLFIAHELFGRGGGIVLGLAVSMACLTTAIALTVVCGEYFNKLSFGRLSYRTVCLVVAGLSLVFANFGLEQIIALAVPPLVALYPVVMVLVILSLLSPRLSNRNLWRGAVAGAFAAGLIKAIHIAQIGNEHVDALFDLIPLTDHGLGWVLPTVALGFAGSLIREREDEHFRVLVLCPSQLETRVAIYDDTMPVFESRVPHNLDRAMDTSERIAELNSLKEHLRDRLSQEHIDLSTVNAVVARGGFVHPLPGGVYRIAEPMVRDLAEHAWRHHPSNWGAAIAFEIANENDIDAYIVDPVVVDEMDEIAHLLGLPDMRRSSIFHASSQKQTARRIAKNLWKSYDRINVIIAHLGEGTSVGAHRKGRVVDVNNALDGDGPFSMLNAGSLPTVDVVRLCFEEGASQEAVLARIRSHGGLAAHLGTADAEVICARVASGDTKACEAIEAMAYQTAKWIGAMSIPLDGRVDGIGITGDLAACPELTRAIRKRVRHLAPVFIFPNDSETHALVGGVLRALRGEEEVREYEPL